jgi:hypothetical protein
MNINTEVLCCFLSFFFFFNLQEYVINFFGEFYLPCLEFWDFPPAKLPSVLLLIEKALSNTVDILELLKQLSCQLMVSKVVCVAFVLVPMLCRFHLALNSL